MLRPLWGQVQKKNVDGKQKITEKNPQFLTETSVIVNELHGFQLI